MSTNPVNLLIIGVGLHAQKVYLPALFKESERQQIQICLGIDLESQRESIEAYLSLKNIRLPMLYIAPFQNHRQLPPFLDLYLTAFVKENDIQGVVISVEPLCHYVYAKWALKTGLHVLMDKPFSTRKNVVSEESQALGIQEDYEELSSLYRALQLEKPTIFSINVQRRYHSGFQKVLSCIREVAERFDAPVTSIQSFHADGQWRLPNEIVDQEYHTYNQGYGKCSHSGYHLFDILYQFYQAGFRLGKFADSMQVISSFVQPRGFLMQFNEKNYEDYFGPAYQSVKKRDDKELYDLFEHFGEMDATVLIRFLKNGEILCNATLNLLHNSFARRHWVQPGKDLYKGNGRVKHECHSIQQGPFQCLQIHSYQKNDRHEQNTEKDFLWGGNNHFELHVFRNSEMFGSGEVPLRIYNIKDIYEENQCGSNCELVHDKAKKLVIYEFIDFIKGKISKEQLKSNIDSHKMTNQLMSGSYLSHVQQMRDRTSLAASVLL